MPVTTTKLALPTPVTADNNDTPTYMLNLANAIVSSLDFGLYSARPAASVANQGRRYYATDRDREYINNAAGAWQPLGGTPPGALQEFLVNAIPTGWILLDGVTVTGCATTYPDLWAVLPTALKSGSDFLTPDMRARSAMGADAFGLGTAGARGSVPGLTVGATTGANTKTISTANLPAHAHDMSHGHTLTPGAAGGHSHEIMFMNSGNGLAQYACRQVPDSNLAVIGNYAGGPRNQTYPQADHTHSDTLGAFSGTTANVGSGTAFNVIDDCIAVVWCIRT